MRKTVLLIVTGICLAAVSRGWALPSGSYDATVTPTSDYNTSVLLGPTFSFEYWFETNALPGSYKPGDNFDVLAVQATNGAVDFLGQVDAYYTSTNWGGAVLDVPLSLQGLERNIRFHLSDFPPETDPVVYLRNISDGDNVEPVPEPASLMMLSTGLLGFLGMRRMSKI